ncbi:unknown [Feldmannia species virus]|uniref:Uncharacterized protein n=1 Tax=Feldmannia species virus TaxID=39420 RepID=B5LWJ0_9PHYC|nr:hypothetical protein FeldSpV_gp101 [Feldmannia species virus]ACH46853.1 unknown [Feldmannia species virus]
MPRESYTHVEQDIQERSDDAWSYQYTVPHQNYVVLFICENSPGPSAVKIFGAYRTLEDANRAADKISNEMDFFDVYVADTNAWVPIPPSQEFVEEVEYQEKRMSEIKDTFIKMKQRDAAQMRRRIETSKSSDVAAPPSSPVGEA